MKFIFTLFIFFYFLNYSLAQDIKPVKKILLINTLSSSYPATSIFENGFKSELANCNDYEFDIIYEYLDLSRFEKEKDYYHILEYYFKEKYKNNLPDVVVVSLSRSSYFFSLKYKDIFPGVPVIVNDDSAEELSPVKVSEHFIWIIPTLNIETTFELIFKLNPDLKNVYIVIGNSEKEKYMEKQLLISSQKYKNGVKFVFLSNHSLSDILDEVKMADENSVILYITLFNDITGRSYIPMEVLKKIREVLSVPIYGTYEQTLGKGVLGGYMLSLELFGKYSAKTCIDIIKKNNISLKTIKIIPCRYSFDYREMKRFNIDEKKLPKGSLIMYKEYTIWELYYVYIISIFLFMIIEGVLIFMLLLNRSSRIKAEKEILKMNVELESKIRERTKQLEILNATKDKFFSIISHDLRGPVGSLNETLEWMINDHVPHDEIYSILLLFKENVQTTYDFLEGLLTWSRSQSGKINFELRANDLYILLHTCIDLCLPMAERKKISLFCNLDETCVAFFDYDMISTVVRNLLNNAIKYTYENGIITISVKKDIKYIEISVKDTGIGMAKDISGNLFRIDVKSYSMEGTKGEKGTGLGLIICKEFVEKHGGKIWVESEPGIGSEFKFTIENKVTGNDKI